MALAFESADAAGRRIQGDSGHRRCVRTGRCSRYDVRRRYGSRKSAEVNQRGRTAKPVAQNGRTITSTTISAAAMPGNLVHDPQRPVLERPLAPRELLAVAAHPALIAGQRDDQRELGAGTSLAQAPMM